MIAKWPRYKYVVYKTDLYELLLFAVFFSELDWGGGGGLSIC